MFGYETQVSVGHSGSSECLGYMGSVHIVQELIAPLSTHTVVTARQRDRQPLHLTVHMPPRVNTF